MSFNRSLKGKRENARCLDRSLKGRASVAGKPAHVCLSMVRNGDAHLKNFGVLYASCGGTVSIAPVFDVITTTAYIPRDIPALTIDGTKKWWPRKMLERFAITHLSLPIGEIGEIISRVADAVMETRQKIPHYIVDHPEFKEIGGRMMTIWETGVLDLVPKHAISIGTSDDKPGEEPSDPSPGM